MPSAPGRPCNYPGCSDLTGGLECGHRNRKVAETSAARRLASPHEKFYQTAAWRKMRARVLREEPTCPGWRRVCGKPTTQVDHIVRRTRGGAELERANLRAYCASCHARKSQWERQAESA